MSRILGVVGAVAAVALCACGQKDAAKPDTSKAAQAGAPASQASFDPATHVAVVHAKDFAFDAPDSVTSGWTTFKLMNDGPGYHHIEFVRVDSGETIQDLVPALDAMLAGKGPPPAWLLMMAGPNVPNPGAESEATVNLTPGSYAILCLVDLPGGVMHFDKGMIRALKVTPAATPAPEPNADVTVTLADYSFTIQGPLTAGAHTFKIVNKGPQPHEVEISRFAEGKTMKDLGEFMTAAYSGKASGPPPASPVGGVSGGIPGQVSYFTSNLAPGKYVMLCFISDLKDHKTHLEHGMVKEFEVR
jgi:hypothetical protein